MISGDDFCGKHQVCMEAVLCYPAIAIIENQKYACILERSALKSHVQGCTFTFSQTLCSFEKHCSQVRICLQSMLFYLQCYSTLSLENCVLVKIYCRNHCSKFKFHDVQERSFDRRNNHLLRIFDV